MCGIGGVLKLRTSSPGLTDAGAQRLGGSLSHRGRSSRGEFSDAAITLHAARHAVVAVDEADQPLYDASGTKVLIGNGEIYNYQELARRIPANRRPATKAGDLQVALQMCADEGIAALESVRGPFAVAMWDRNAQVLSLARDRLGERPLYYYMDDDVFIFASEVRCVEAALGGAPALDAGSMLAFLGLGRTLGDRTQFAAIKSIAPGELLAIGPNHRLARSRLKAVSALRDQEMGEAGLQEVLQLLDQANERVLLSDSAPAVGFSGGIDSSIVLNAALQRSRVAAAITVYSEADSAADVNLHRARDVSKLFGVELLEVPFTLPGFQETLSILHGTLDQPCAEPLVLHNDALHRAAQGVAPVVLGGHGADEVFGGYARYAQLLAEEADVDTQEWMTKSAWERWNRAAHWTREVTPILSEEWLRTTHLGNDALDRPFAYDDHERTDRVLFGQALDLFKLMSYDNFRATDENGIARGVEVRSPFFDIDLIAGVFSMPVQTRMSPSPSKWILHRALAGSPAASAFNVKKVGFDDNFPYPAWIESNWPKYEELIYDGPLGDLGIIKESARESLRNASWRMKWRVFALAAWLVR